MKDQASRLGYKQARPPALHGFRFHRDHTATATATVNGQRPRSTATVSVNGLGHTPLDINMRLCYISFAGVAQLAEQRSPKPQVVSSNLAAGATTWRLMDE